MQIQRFGWLMVFLCLEAVAQTGPLTFIAQPDSPGGTTNYSWFSAENWFEPAETGELVAAGRVPRASESVVITGGVDVGMGGVRVQSLDLTENASATNGTISVEQLTMRRGATFENSTVNVLLSMRVTGPRAVVRGGVLNVLFIARATLEPSAPETEASLVLEKGAALGNSGVITLTDATRILGGSLPAGRLVLQSGSTLISKGAAFAGSEVPGALTIDNSGLVTCADGTLRFGDVGWLASGGKGEFNAQAGSVINFEKPFHAAAGTLIHFTGAGTNRWMEGATVDGVVRIGPGESNDLPSGSNGNLELHGNAAGVGLIEATAATNSAGAVAWRRGDVSIPSLQVLPGAQLALDSGLPPVSLSATAVHNAGTCVLASGTIRFESAAALTNLAGAVVELTGPVTFLETGPQSGPSVFANEGLVVKSGSAIAQLGGAGTNSGPELVNTGLIEILAGELQVGPGTTSGEFRTSTNSLLVFSAGRHRFTPGASLHGPGTVRLAGTVSPVLLDLETALTLAQLEVGQDAIVNGRNAMQLVNAPRLVLTGNSILTNLVVTTTNLQVLQRPSLFNGQVLVDPGRTGRAEARITATNLVLHNTLLELSAGHSVVEPAAPDENALVVLHQSTIGVGGELMLAPSVRFALGSTSGSPSRVLVRPTGTVRTVLTGAPVVIAPNFENSGSLEIQGGQLQFQGTWVQHEGRTFVAEGAALSAPVLQLNFGDLSGQGVLTGTFINGSNLYPGPARVAPGFGPGVLSLAPFAAYQQQNGGTLFIEIGGRRAGSEYDQFVVTGRATLSGRLEVTLANEFTPAVGDVFEVLRFSDRVGRFSGIDLPTMESLLFLPEYGQTNLVLRVATPVVLNEARYTGTSYELTLQTLAGRTYEIQATDDLGSATWDTIGTLVGNGSRQTFTIPIAPSDTLMFYRALLR